MKRKISIAALTLCLLLCLGACGSNGSSITVTKSLEGREVLVGDKLPDFPLVSEPAELSVMVCSFPNINSEDVFVWQKYEEMSGVKINWIDVTKEQRSEAVNTALTNRQSLDLILRCKISATRLTKYGQYGLILDLAADDLLKNNAPNCWAYLQSHPETLASITDPDGAIYALPQVNAGAELRVSRKLFINKQWLSRVNMDIPRTTEELYRLLTAFKEQDANGNGDPSDEIPFCPIDWLSVEETFYGAFGLGNRGVHNMVVDADENGRARLIAASDGYRAFLDYMNKLYSEKLLDPRVFNITDELWSDAAKKDQIGMFASTNLASLPADKLDNWVAVEDALIGSSGDSLWAGVRGDFHSTGAALIPATCKNPELVLRWLDYFWSDEGTLFYHMGIEGETFVANSDGSFDYDPRLYEQMKTENKSFDEVIAQYSPYPGGGNPTVEIAPYFMGGEMADVPAQAARSLFEYAADEFWPSFTFTAEENEELNLVRTDIAKYIDSMLREFVSGSRDLSDWDSYLAQLDSMNASRMLEIYQAAIDRYYSQTK